ncbi:hypothetical protein [Devosia sp. UYZn731]|uniref:hypothetical protein n=1 Tax=Devosia sp. UYZn731 TaxID=3156345 RepID=UPI003395D35D
MINLFWTAILGCSAWSEEPPVLPPEAAGITQPAEYSFGSVTQAADWRATVTVLDQLESRFGEKSIRILPRNLDVRITPQAIKAHYSDRLSQEPSWTEIPLASFGPANSAWAFALVSSNGNWVFAVEALEASESSGGIVPLNILTNIRN